MSKSKINIVVNAPAASGADLTRPGGGRVLVTGDTKGFLRPKVVDIKVNLFLAETLADINVTATASPAANTTYRFIIEQEKTDSQQNKQPKRYTIEYVAQAGVTATILGTALAASVQALIDSGELEATSTAITSGNGGVTVTGVAGAGLVRVVQPESMTVATGLLSGTSSGNLSASGTTITLLNSSTAGVAIGSLVKVSGWTGTAVINGKTAAQGTTLRATAVSTNTSITFVADTITGSISAAVATLELLAAEQRGLGSDLTAERGIVGQNDALVAATVYHEVVVEYYEPSGTTMTVEDGSPIQKSYFIDASTSAANGLNLVTQLIYVKGYLDSTGAVADPLLL